MCGITGVIVKNNPEYVTEVYFNILRASDIRGQDGTGVTILRNQEFLELKWERRAKLIDYFPELEIGDKVIGQNRYAIFGLDHKNDQPLITDNFALVHNGVLYDYEKQFEDIQKQEEIFLKKELKVDTELVLRLVEYFYPDMHMVLRIFKGEAACLLLSNINSYPSFTAFMKNKILYSGEDKYGNIYFFSTLYIKNKVPQICKNIYEFKNNEIKIY